MGCRDNGCVLDGIREIVDAEWEARLGVDRALLDGGGVQVISADLGSNDAMSFLLGDTCFVVVSDDEVARARRLVFRRNPWEVFSAETLFDLVGPDGRVDRPSVHTYADEASFGGAADPDAVAVGGGDVELMAFLKASELEEWAESGSRGIHRLPTLRRHGSGS